MPDNPNPQGKGLVPVLEQWQSAQPAAVAAKDARTMLSDYAVSLLVLSAQFKFKPVAGNTYYLYWCQDIWQLSLIAPGEWTDDRPRQFVGECKLRPDMTWTLLPANDLSRRHELVEALNTFVSHFVATLDTTDTLEAGLPFYLSNLPFYQRLLATGLASSLRTSARLSELPGRSARFWLTQSDGHAFPALT